MRKKGFTLIELLIVVAIIAILAAIAVPNFLEAQIRSKVSRVKADHRSLATALESYYVDNNSYPASDSSDWAADAFGANGGLVGASPFLLNMPTFLLKEDTSAPLHTLTTPISYITSYFPDPFANSAGATFLYAVPDQGLGAEIANSGWLIWSFGPDVDENISNDGSNFSGDIGLFDTGEGPVLQGTFYDPSRNLSSLGPLTNATYDPTNGTTSNGDVWRAKQ